MAQGTATAQGPQSGQLARVLLVDDNDRYAAALTEDLESREVQEIVRAVSAKQGIELLHEHGSEFDGVVSDISMESQLSGLRVLRAARRYQGDRPLMVACATTGLDTPIGYWFNEFLLGSIYRCDFLIPKRPIKQDSKVIWVRGASIWTPPEG